MVALPEGDFDGFVDRACMPETQSLIQPHGTTVLSRDFEKSFTQSVLLKSVEGADNQSRTDPALAMVGNRTHVLNTADALRCTQSLDGSAVATEVLIHAVVYGQPSGLRQKPVAFADLVHQLQAARRLAQTMKDLRIEFAIKTTMLYVRMFFEEIRPPRLETIVGMGRNDRKNTTKVEFHSKSFEVMNRHCLHFCPVKKNTGTIHVHANFDRRVIVDAKRCGVGVRPTPVIYPADDARSTKTLLLPSL